MPRRVTRTRLEKIKDRASRATDGPWKVTPEIDGPPTFTRVVAHGAAVLSSAERHGRRSHNLRAAANAAFAAKARQDVPDLVAELERAWARISSLRAALIEIGHDSGLNPEDGWARQRATLALVADLKEA